MPNPIKYSVSSQPNALKKGNFYLGTGDVGKGPTSGTDYYNGITPPNGGYTIYQNKAGSGPSIYTCSADSQLLYYTTAIAGTSYTNVNESLVYFAGQSDKMVLNIEYGNIITEGLVFNLDAGFVPSYPRSGDTWSDLSGNNYNGTLVNQPTFSYNGSGNIFFNGTDEYASTTYSGVVGTNPRTISIWFKPETTQNKNLLGYGSQTANRMWDILLSGGSVGVNVFGSGTEASTAYTAGTWQNITFSYTHPTIKSYMNGVYKNQYTNSSIDTGTDNLLSIARGVLSTYQYFNGSIANVLIYNRELTATEILQNYNALSGRYTFTSTWNTANTSAGSSTSTQVKLPLVSTGTYNMVVDWGDNSTNTITTWNQAETTHSYALSGTYEIKITGICKGWRFVSTGDRLKLLNVSKWGSLEITTDSAFYGCTNLSASTQDAPVISSTSLLDTFRDCSNFNGNLNNWDVSNVTNMQQMFLNALRFNQPIGNWNTSKVTNMLQMFREARAFNQDIGGWDVSKVTSMNGANTGMFYSAVAHNFNNGGSPSINNWNMSGITSLYDMFNGCTNFNQPIGSWNISNVTTTNRTFNACSAFNQDLSNWNMSKVIEATEMFRNCSFFNNGGSPNINNWIMSACTSLQLTFGGATRFNQPVNSWNTSSVTNMLQTFYAARAFNQPLSSWNTSNVTSMLAMFREAVSFHQDVTMWDVSKVSSFGSSNNGMFFDANVFNQNLSNWDLRIAGTDLTEMFRTNSSINGMSCQNYTDTIVGWANYVQINGGPLNVSMTNQNSRKFDGARSGGVGFANASAARTYLTTATPTGAGWTISGDILGTC
jgi:surface protein